LDQMIQTWLKEASHWQEFRKHYCS
jgi:hypothetical protein